MYGVDLTLLCKLTDCPGPISGSVVASLRCCTGCRLGFFTCQSYMTHPSLLRGRRALFSFVILVDGSSSPHSSPQNCAHGRQGSAGCEQNVQKMTGRGPTLFLSRLPTHNVPSIDRFVPGATCIVVQYIPRSIIRIRCTARKKQEMKRERWCVQERECVCHRYSWSERLSDTTHASSRPFFD